MGGHQKLQSTRDLGRWAGLRPERGPDSHPGAREEKEVALGAHKHQRRSQQRTLERSSQGDKGKVREGAS